MALALCPEGCVCAGEPVVRAGGFHSQHGDLRLGRRRQAGQQQERPETQILQAGEAEHVSTESESRSTFSFVVVDESDLVVFVLLLPALYAGSR